MNLNDCRHNQWLHYCLTVSKSNTGPLLCSVWVFSFFTGGSIIYQLCLQEGLSLWSAQITDNMQGMEIDGLYGLGSECVYWVDEMTGFSVLSLAFALLSPLIGFSRALSSSVSSHLSSLSLCIMLPLLFSTFLLKYGTPSLHLPIHSTPFLFSIFLTLNAADQSVRQGSQRAVF